MQNIQLISRLLNNYPYVMDAKRDAIPLISLLLEMLENDIGSDDSVQVLEEIKKISNANIDSANVISYFTIRLFKLGLKANSEGKYHIAELIFQMLGESYHATMHSDSSEKNQCEVANTSNHNNFSALQFLCECTNAVSWVDTALDFALLIGDDDSWHLADDIFNRLSDIDGKLVSPGCEKMARKGDREGYLVIFFLLRHKKINKSSLGPIQKIVLRLKRDIKSFPEWLDYPIDTLEDALECIEGDEDDSEFILSDFLDNMQCSRKEVDKLLSVISKGDIQPIYEKLFADCLPLLAPGEQTKLKNDYMAKFFNPSMIDDLPFEIETISSKDDPNYEESKLDIKEKDGLLFTLNGLGVTIQGISDNFNAEDLIIPQKVCGYMVDEIGNNAFEGCDCIKSVVLPEGVTQIGGYSFRNCMSLESISIPTSVSEIRESAFEGCCNLKTVSMRDGLIWIGKDAFKSCNQLTNITFLSKIR